MKLSVTIVLSNLITFTAVATSADRQSRRREHTRRRLLDAATALFAEQGVESTRINEITERADVGFGSFYNHFKSKEAIVGAVVEETVAAQATALTERTRLLDDHAEVVSVAHRHFVALASTDPQWAWLFVRLDASYNVALAALEPFAERDLEAGVAAGRFTVSDPATALVVSGGALMGVMRAVLDGRLGPDVGSHHAEAILRSFGVSPADAAEVAARPMPSPSPAG